ncbi:hypothetical protein MKEN_01005600 [Mycena kentingensis (nom. inval.)]|nr:hypothetical protein MKEN_01005600 [Mycena kentingensis (nom. inval.)]
MRTQFASLAALSIFALVFASPILKLDPTTGKPLQPDAGSVDGNSILMAAATNPSPVPLAASAGGVAWSAAAAAPQSQQATLQSMNQLGGLLSELLSLVSGLLTALLGGGGSADILGGLTSGGGSGGAGGSAALLGGLTSGGGSSVLGGLTGGASASAGGGSALSSGQVSNLLGTVGGLTSGFTQSKGTIPTSGNFQSFAAPANSLANQLGSFAQQISTLSGASLPPGVSRSAVGNGVGNLVGAYQTWLNTIVPRTGKQQNSVRNTGQTVVQSLRSAANLWQ